MRKHTLPCLIVACLLSGACTNNRTVDREKIEATALRDVSKVMQTSPNTMQREKAVLAIRVRERELRDNGYDEEADIYINIAQTMLIDSLNIISPTGTVNKCE